MGCSTVTARSVSPAVSLWSATVGGQCAAREDVSIVLLNGQGTFDRDHLFGTVGDFDGLIRFGLAVGDSAQPDHPIGVGIDLNASQTGAMFRRQLRLDFGRDGRVFDKRDGMDAVGVRVFGSKSRDRQKGCADDKTCDCEFRFHGNCR